VPFSSIDEGDVFNFGEPQTTTEIFEAAVVKFDSALTIAEAIGADADALAALAQVGMGRALLNLNQPAAAAAAVAGVDTDFEYLIEHSDNSVRQNNGVWEYSFNQGRWVVAESESGEGLPFRSAGDPRVVVDTAPANQFDGSTGYLPLKHGDRDVDAVLASGVEARLIEAEAELRAGDAVAWASIHTTLRARVGLLPLVDPGTQAAREDLHFRERAFWLFLTSHRLGDLRRLVRQYSRPADTVFPSGAYPAGGLYGSDLNFPVPFDEENNPNFEGCLDRNA
jgi:hypothetical protein